MDVRFATRTTGPVPFVTDGADVTDPCAGPQPLEYVLTAEVGVFVLTSAESAGFETIFVPTARAVPFTQDRNVVRCDVPSVADYEVVALT